MINLKRVITLALLIVAAFILQVSVFPFFSLAHIIPNFMLILVVSIALMRGQVEGMMVGFFGGLLLDIFSGGAIGVYALLYTVMGYLNGYFNKLFYHGNVLLPMGLVIVNCTAYNFVIYITMFLLRKRLNILFYIRRIIIPEVVYTFFIAIFVYSFLLYINAWLEKSEKRSTI